MWLSQVAQPQLGKKKKKTLFFLAHWSVLPNHRSESILSFLALSSVVALFFSRRNLVHNTGNTLVLSFFAIATLLLSPRSLLARSLAITLSKPRIHFLPSSSSRSRAQ